ncbi:SIS domain-containing protein [Xenorhabdus lircayensis]|uniref:SIS domain-containing protein n=1 Tax=Xenorhabdus lircayensis TaxID=2763499 RepID=A0ABS0U302_9GAMM|nr:SIS domain-containing protein [Xenorhabdus lircayensis]MBI6548261.1 SIS domain-containing protein [Xenorhabdus lircayensis]
MKTVYSYSEKWLDEHQARFTAEEIHHQPALWRCLHQELLGSAGKWQPFLQPLLANPNLRIILCGAGSSAFVGRVIALWLHEQCGLNVKAYASTDIVLAPQLYLTEKHHLTEKHLTEEHPTLLVSYARSGNSPESVASVALADQLLPNCHHLFLTCNPDGALARYAESKSNVCSLIMPEGSHDQSFVMTSSFSCMALATILLLSGISLAETDKYVEQMATLCEQNEMNWHQYAQSLSMSGFGRFVVLGSHCFSGIAEEAALKMLELTAGRVMTRHDSSMGVRHGPKVMIEDNTLVVIMLSSKPYCRQYDLDLLNELKLDGLARDIIALSGLPQADCLVLNTDLEDIWLTFPYLMFLQLLAFEMSLAHGLTPDNPCPTGEVNRVVKGVQIYPYNRHYHIHLSQRT